MTGVVLDTNVLVSANLNDDGLEPFVISLALSSRLPPILAEYERVLRYPRLKFIPDEIASFLKRVHQAGTRVSPTYTITKARHEPDNRFLEFAEAAGADFR